MMEKRKVIWLLILVIIIASFLRLYKITTVPPGLYPDEAMNGNNVLEALRTGHFQVFYPENNGREGLFINVQALALKFFGVREPWVLRLPSALFGILTVLGIYFLAAELFSAEIGLLAAFLLATSFWHINFSRIGFRAITAPFFLTWALYFLIKGFKKLEAGAKFQKATLYHVIGGIIFGLGFYSYIAYRVMPALVLFVFAYYIAKAWRGNSRKQFLHSAAHFVFFAIIVAVPLGWYFYAHPGSFFGRTTQVSVFSSATPIKDLALNILKTAAMFNFRGDWNWRHNVSGDPELFWPVGLLFLLGVWIGIHTLIKNVKIKNQNDSLKIKNGSLANGSKILNFDFSTLILFLWFLLAALPVVISNEGIPHALRSILMLPPAIIFAAIGGMRLYQWLMERANYEKLIKACAWIFLIIVLAFAYEDYFFVWGRDLSVASAFADNYVVFAHELNALPANIPKYIIVSARGVPVRGIPMPAQTIMFITDTFSPDGQAAKNVHYVLPDKVNKIPPGAFTAVLK